MEQQVAGGLALTSAQRLWRCMTLLHAALQLRIRISSAFACLRQVRGYVRRGVPLEQAVAEAAAWAELTRTFESTTLDVASCAAACALTFHAPWNRQFQELLQLMVRLQAARRGSVARSTYHQARSPSMRFIPARCPVDHVACWSCTLQPSDVIVVPSKAACESKFSAAIPACF